MAKFPVQLNDQKGIQDGLNYLLSGPAGLGQNFAGFSSYQTVQLNGNFRAPYTSASGNLYVAPIALSTSVLLDPQTWQLNFATPQSTLPFALGQPIRIQDVTSTYGQYNGGYQPIGVVSCTTTYVICKTNGSYFDSTGTGGSATFSNMSSNINNLNYISTDCTALVTVSGGTDRVFISGQLDNTLTYVNGSNSTLNYIVSINRYVAFNAGSPSQPNYEYIFDATVASKTYTYTGLSSGTLPLIETIFTTILDQPKPNLYRYYIEVAFVGTNSLQIETAQLDLRSLSAQVVKQ